MQGDLVMGDEDINDICGGDFFSSLVDQGDGGSYRFAESRKPEFDIQSAAVWIEIRAEIQDLDFSVLGSELVWLEEYVFAHGFFQLENPGLS